MGLRPFLFYTNVFQFINSKMSYVKQGTLIRLFVNLISYVMQSFNYRDIIFFYYTITPAFKSWKCKDKNLALAKPRAYLG